MVRRIRPSTVVVLALLGAATVYFLLPVVWVLVAATKSSADLFGTFGFWSPDPQLGANLSRLFGTDDGLFGRWILNSFLYAGVGALIATLLSACAGYAMAKYPFPGREALFNLVLAGVLVPATVLALPTYLIFSQGLFGRWILNSFLYAGVGALIATLLSACAGYAMAKYPFPGREALFNLVLAGVLVPATVLALPTYLIFSQVGVTGTFWSVLLPSVVSPFGVYLARIQANAAIPDALLESARLDGAGEYRIFFRIALKIMSPALVTIFLFQFIGVWNNYFLPLVMLSDQRLYPVTLGLAQWNSQTFRDPAFYELTVTGAAVSALLLVLTMASLQRFWRAGLTAGSVKG
ncbi:ABC-type glycerol-3-phosphate transport system permease component [Streptosporangium becharense]|uniref:ABC-type glycerol-3-phosphate transport system permease component n=1 Tax=Streptosporangium becharense TaxID=1816182 RepID=A0A7W9IJH2_9ACTN|nr:carbohydrate ABC transporter permease [Streptosporangium becharense]MBB5821857.1 ABC-type glycerol-3-phosphate transport system permease component [Streptosporangium becharense]